MRGCIVPGCGSLKTLTLVGKDWYCGQHLKHSPFAATGDVIRCPSCLAFTAASLWTTDNGTSHNECGICSYTWDTTSPALDQETCYTLPRLPDHETP